MKTLLIEVPDGVDEVRIVMNGVTVNLLHYVYTGSPDALIPAKERGVVVKCSGSIVTDKRQTPGQIKVVATD